MHCGMRWGGMLRESGKWHESMKEEWKDGWRRMHCWVGGRMGKVGSTESITQLSAGVIFGWINLCWNVDGLKSWRLRRGRGALFGVRRVREDAMSWNRIWRDEFPLQGLSASFQTSLSPLYYSVGTHSSASPPTSKTKDMSEKPVGHGMCGIRILPTAHMGRRAHGCSKIHNAAEYFRMIQTHFYNTYSDLRCDRECEWLFVSLRLPCDNCWLVQGLPCLWPDGSWESLLQG